MLHFLHFRHWVITFPLLMYISVILILVVYGTLYLMNASDMTDEIIQDSNVKGIVKRVMAPILYTKLFFISNNKSFHKFS